MEHTSTSLKKNNAEMGKFSRLTSTWLRSRKRFEQCQKMQEQKPTRILLFSNVTALILKKVIDWCEKHKDEEEVEESKETNPEEIVKPEEDYEAPKYLKDESDVPPCSPEKETTTEDKETY